MPDDSLVDSPPLVRTREDAFEVSVTVHLHPDSRRAVCVVEVVDDYTAAPYYWHLSQSWGSEDSIDQLVAAGVARFRRMLEVYRAPF